MTAVRIPDLGEIVEQVTIVRWMKQVGDRVELDEDLYEVTTEKLDVVLQSPAAGVLAEIRVEAGLKVPVGTEVALIR